MGDITPTSPVRPPDSAAGGAVGAVAVFAHDVHHRVRAFSETSARPFMTRDTVAVDTPGEISDLADRQPRTSVRCRLQAFPW